MPLPNVRTVILRSLGGFDSYVKSLLHMDGADASTTFLDQTGKIWTAVADAQIDTAQSKFAGASGLFDGTGDYITTPDHADFTLGTSDFTIDFWIRFNSVATINFLWGQGTSGSYSALYWNANTLVFNVLSASATVIDVTKAWTPTTNTWYHVAVVRSGSSFYMFIDGTQIGTTVTDVDPIPDWSSVVYIGGWAVAAQYLNGWIDEFRFSKDVARWVNSFSPPTAPYR